MAFSQRRPRRYRQSSAKLPLWAIPLICLAAAVVLTVIVGNLLKLWLDDETYDKLTSLPDTTDQEELLTPNTVRNVHAYPFRAGEDPANASAHLAVSVSINDPTGTVQYASPVANYQGRECSTDASLNESIGALRAYGIYVSGVFHPQAFSQSGTDLRYAVAAEEGALMREFLQMGGCEILISDIPYAGTNIEAIVSYLSAVKTAVGDAPLGVAVPLSVAQASDGGILLERLLTICDFCALDMTDAIITDETLNDIGICAQADEALQQIGFYLQSYDMRLLLCEEQTLLINAAELRMVEDYQIVSHLHLPVTPPPEET